VSCASTDMPNCAATWESLVPDVCISGFQLMGLSLIVQDGGNIKKLENIFVEIHGSLQERMCPEMK
jgi:hypothetical protein